MSTFKSNLFEICKDVAVEFPDWIFVSGQFKNKSLRHTDLIIHPGFGFDNGITPLQPGVIVNHKRSMALYKKINGYELSTSIVNFQAVSQTLIYMPECFRLTSWISQNKKNYLFESKASKVVEAVTMDITEAYSVLVAMMKDGISFIEKHYDLSSEENFLKKLPPKYTTRHVNSPYDELEKQKGVMMCIVHILLGDFDFVERYQSADFETIFPKRTTELDKIMSALPELRRKFAETGAVI